jgi:CRISPR-associated endonuclease Csn1
MKKILGLDLGTNSIGWSLRITDLIEREIYYKNYFTEKYEKFFNESDDTNLNLDNEIVDYGVVIFKKGVGDGKSGEFSLAAERRKNRSKRRLYNAKRYRKWALLKVLIENDMCPLTIEELRLWSIGDWQEIKGKWENLGRIYPVDNKRFQQWIAFDPAIFGNKGLSVNRNTIRKNPYDLRCELIENEETNDYLKKLKIGRALYHLVQRRGFKSSRKSGQSAYAKNEDIEKIKTENPSFQIAALAKEKLDNGQRFRASGVVQRKYFEDEFYAISEKQNLNKELTEKLYKAIYFVRPLRSQKGLVGNCTLEKGKPRIPISHPKFEEFRALQFINNIKWKEKGTKEFVAIPIYLKKKIFEELFFKKLTSGKNKGKINEENHFNFNEIIKNFSENGTYEFNYKNLPNVSACPTIAMLMNVFDADWTERFIQDDNTYGINWEGLTISYTVKYGKKVGQNRTLKIDEIWHLLYDNLQTKDKQEDLEKFSKEVLDFDENKAKAFSSIDIPQGYGSLSYKAISKILTFLQSGFIYSEAVLFANLKKVMGVQFEDKKEVAKRLIAEVIKETGRTKEKLNITNALIQKYFAKAETNHVKSVNDTFKEMAWQDTVDRLKIYFGESDWNKKSEVEREKLEQEVFNLYSRFLNREQTKEEKTSAKDNYVPEIDYYKLPRLDEVIKQNLKDKFILSDKELKYLYHPSDIEMYPISKTEISNTDIKLLESPQPPSKGWKNPMAMRTLHELRHLLNYLLKIGKIDKDTKIVVEMARELNDANKRKAIEAWQNDKNKENQEYALAIAELYNISAPSDDDYKLFKAAVEQLVEENKSLEFLQKYKEFIETFLIKKNKNNKGQQEETENEVEETPNDYLMYLILTRDEFTKLLLNQPAGAGKILNLAKDFKNKRNTIIGMLTKYKLWKEQKFQCFYTGHYIPFTELFSSNYQIEHTIPRSISFDSELKNLTVCDAAYNAQVKNNKFPTECLNYNDSANCKTVKGIMLCSPISERVGKMIGPKVEELIKRIKNLTEASKKIPNWEKDKKNANIRLRHYLQFELQYWEKKLLTFTIKKEEWKDAWKNSQLVDTQIISKYARSYLKTVFEKVDVQKGTTTDTFKKIYKIKGNEQKDRSKHSHHAQDAAILTLIPGSAKREAILEKYFQAEENNKPTFHTKPYENFHSSHIHEIENNIIINHIPHDKTLTTTIKNIRKRGVKTGRVAQGDSIRGQLHEETYFGAIKPNIYNENGKAIKDDETGEYLKRQLNGEDVIWIVQRKKIDEVDIDSIIDEALKKHIKDQLSNGIKITEIKDFAGKKIRHIRFKKFSPSYEKTLKVKPHTYISKRDHKLLYMANNETNYLCLFYIGVDKNGKEIRNFRFINLFEFSRMANKQIKSLFNNPEYKTFIKINHNNEYKLQLKNILKAGQKVILYRDSVEEIDKSNLEAFRNRIYQIYKFNNSGSDYVFVQNIIEARNDEELKKAGYKKDGDTEFLPDKYQHRLKLTADKLNCLFENIDFEINPDGKIVWLTKIG